MGEDHLFAQELLCVRADAYLDAKQWDEAAKIFARLLECDRIAVVDQTVRNSIAQLAKAYEARQRPDKAQRWQEALSKSFNKTAREFLVVNFFISASVSLLT